MKNNKGFLIVHGFGGHLYEIEYLKNDLENKGYHVESPILKGHTGKRKDLGKVNYNEWINSAEEGLIELKKRCDDIFLIGFSMGGLICINLALKHHIKGLVTINSPIYYWDIKKISSNIVSDIKNREYNNIEKYINSTFKFPISALVNFRVLLYKTKPIVKDVKCPTLVIQAMDDDTVRNTSGKYIYDNVCGDIKNIKYFEKGGHEILCSNTSRDVAKETYNFINKL